MTIHHSPVGARTIPPDGLGRALRDVSVLPPSVRGAASTRPPLPSKGSGAKASLKGDLMGGFTAAVIALPLALAFGVSTFEPLGPGYASVGALAGITAAVMGCFVASLFGGTPAQITGPTGPMTVVVSAVLGGLVANPPTVAAGGDPIAAILTFTFLTTLLGGAVQVVLGLLNIGRLVRYIPYPVIAGFMNGIALIILLGQAPYFLGIASGTGLWKGLAGFALSGATVAVGAITAASLVIAPHLTKRVPASLIGLSVGTASFYALQALDFAAGPIVGPVPSALPMPVYVLRFASVLSDETLLPQVPRILGPAVALGVLGAIDSLLTSVVADVVTNTHHNSRRELLGQGSGNMVSACFGGLAGAGTTVATLVNVNAGGRSQRAGMFHSLVLLAVLLVAAPLAAAIPLVVLAAILIVTAVGMIDGWSRKLAIKLATEARSERDLQINLGIIVLVTAITVAVDLMVAVAIGLSISALLFVSKMGGSVVKRVQSGAERRSFRERSPNERRVLSRHGRRIAIVELDGALFFGSTGTLSDTVERLMSRVDYFILDAHHLSEIDGTGAKALQQIHDMLQEAGKELAISHLSPRNPLWAFLGNMGDIECLGEDHFFLDTDRALDWAESRVLSEHAEAEPLPASVPFERMHVTSHMSSSEQQRFRSFLSEVSFLAGETLVDQGAAERRLIIASEGVLSVGLWNACDERQCRITTVQPGIAVGEQAFFEGLPHGVAVTADSDGKGFVLTLESFERMSTEEPALTMRLLFNVARELSARLRKAAEAVASLDH